MVRVRAKVLGGRLGWSPPPLSKSVCSILPLARHFRAGESLVGQPRPAPRFYSQRRANRYSPQTAVRAPPTASAASTQKSIESMHSSLSLAVGYNRVVTHGWRSCNNVVAILAREPYPSLQRS